MSEQTWQEKQSDLMLVESGWPYTKTDLLEVLGITELWPVHAKKVAKLTAISAELGGGLDELAEAIEIAALLARDNIERLGHIMKRSSPNSDRWEWFPPKGGDVYPCSRIGTPNLNAALELGHLRPPCTKCLLPLTNGQLEVDHTVCFGCRHIQEWIDKPGGFVVQSGEHRMLLRDGGRNNRTGQDKSLNGFGGAEWHLVPVGGGDPVATNNMWCAHHDLPACWFAELPITHVRQAETGA